MNSNDGKTLNELKEELKNLLEQINHPAYLRALIEVLKVRVEKSKVYGEGWYNDPIEFDLWMMWGKWRRLEFNIKRGNKNSYEKDVDNAIDLINYGLFLLSKLLTRGDRSARD